MIEGRSSAAIALALVAGIGAACASSEEKCSALNCPGCCLNGGCFVGTQQDLCGTGGAMCLACTAEDMCIQGACQAVSADGGPASRDTGGRDGASSRPEAGPSDSAPRSDDAALGMDATPSVDAGMPAADAAPAADAQPVTGVRSIHHVTDNGEVVVPEDLTTASISAVVSNGTGPVVITGTGHSDGTFEIQAVPEGRYWLGFGKSWIDTTARAVVLDQYAVGRPNTVLATLPMQINYDLRSLSPWVPGSALQLFSTNSGASTGSLLVGGGPAAGTVNVGASENWAAMDTPRLLDASQGDVLVISQFGYESTPAPHFAVRNAATITGVTLVNGQAATIVVNFAPLSTTTLALDWRTTQFEALAAAVRPDAVAGLHRLYFDPVPGGLLHGHYGNGPIVAYVDHAVGAGDLSTQIVHGNPYRNAQIAPAYINDFTFNYQLPGTTALQWITTFRQGDAEASINGVPLAPLLSPPQGVQVNGQSATSNLTQAGLRPSISWRAPVIGIPDAYVVEVFQLQAVAGATQAAFVATLYTRLTTITLPPGIFTAGGSYFLGVEAVKRGGFDPETAPFVSGYPDVIASAYTAIIMP